MIVLMNIMNVVLNILVVTNIGPSDGFTCLDVYQCRVRDNHEHITVEDLTTIS